MMNPVRLFLIAWMSTLSVDAQVSVLKKLTVKGDENIRTFAYTPNSKRIITGGDKGSIEVFELTTGDNWKLPSLPSKVIALEISYDGRFMAASSEDGSFLLFDLQDSKAVELNGEPGKVKSIAFSPSNGQMATGNEEGKIRIWDLSTHERVLAMQGRDAKILVLAFSPSGNFLASGASDNSIGLWDLSSGDAKNFFLGHTDWVRALSFNLDGTKLLSGSYDKTVRVWDIKTGQVEQWKGHHGWVTDLKLSPDGKYVLTGGADGQAILWSTEGKIIQQLKEASQLVSKVQFAFDGKSLAVADITKSMMVYSTASLSIQPWKPFDVTPPSFVILSPKLLATKDATTGNRKSVVYQSEVTVLLEVTDISGLSQVQIGGNVIEPQKDNPERYEFSLVLPQNSEREVTIFAMDKLGNKAEEKLVIERKIFSGGVNDEKYHALLIATQDYDNESITDLDNPIKDMYRLKEVLESKYSFKPENIAVLKNPNRQALYDKLDEYQAKLDKVDNLLIFYAGHGFWDDQLQQGYWFPSDAEPTKRSTWFSNSSLRDYISGISARHTLLITDACFSGGIFKSRAVFENASTAVETLYLRKSRKAMTSGTLEQVPDKSVFIDFLVQRLSENSEPYLTAEELFSGLRKTVINNSPNNQVPQYGVIGQTGDEGGEFIFVRKK